MYGQRQYIFSNQCPDLLQKNLSYRLILHISQQTKRFIRKSIIIICKTQQIIRRSLKYFGYLCQTAGSHLLLIILFYPQMHCRPGSMPVFLENCLHFPFLWNFLPYSALSVFLLPVFLPHCKQ